MHVRNLSHNLQNKLHNIDLRGLSVLSIARTHSIPAKHTLLYHYLSEHFFKIHSHTGHTRQVLHLNSDKFMFPLCKRIYNPFRQAFLVYSLDLVIIWFTQSPTQKSMNPHRISMFMSCFITCRFWDAVTWTLTEELQVDHGAQNSQLH